MRGALFAFTCPEMHVRSGLYQVRYAVVVALLATALAVALAGGIAAAWPADAASPPGRLTVPDVYRVGLEPREIFFHPRLHNGRLPPQAVYYVRSDNGPWQAGRSYGRIALCKLTVIPPETYRPVAVTCRLSEEIPPGPLTAAGRVFFLDPSAPVALVDLESTKAFGRYELHEQRRRWLTGRLAGRQAVYLADVDLADYHALRNQLSESGWPDGPVVMWRRWPSGKRDKPSSILRNQLRDLPVDLAIFGDLEHNDPISRQIQGWNRTAARRSGRVVSVAHWPSP